jgi:hypothetical protein
MVVIGKYKQVLEHYVPTCYYFLLPYLYQLIIHRYNPG